MKTFGLILFFYKTEAIIFAVAIVVIDDCGEPFQVTTFPQIKAIAAFQPKTAFGKLNAVITPTIPSGFQIYIMKCSGLSELKIDPLNKINIYPIDLESPQAISQTSIVYCTSPIPSDFILPIYNETTKPNAYFFYLRASPICLTIYPLLGIGILAH